MYSMSKSAYLLIKLTTIHTHLNIHTYVHMSFVVISIFSITVFSSYK